jgi:hypothetical protein
MRVIINIHSNCTAKSAGWRARAVQINGNKESDLEAILKTVVIVSGTNLYDLISKDGHLSNDLILFVNGTQKPDISGLNINVKNNAQIHIMDKFKK